MSFDWADEAAHKFHSQNFPYVIIHASVDSNYRVFNVSSEEEDGSNRISMIEELRDFANYLEFEYKKEKNE